MSDEPLLAAGESEGDPDARAQRGRHAQQRTEGGRGAWRKAAARPLRMAMSREPEIPKEVWFSGPVERRNRRPAGPKRGRRRGSPLYISGFSIGDGKLFESIMMARVSRDEPAWQWGNVRSERMKWRNMRSERIVHETDPSSQTGRPPGMCGAVCERGGRLWTSTRRCRDMAEFA
jgi:hypothetical protein